MDDLLDLDWKQPVSNSQPQSNPSKPLYDDSLASTSSLSSLPSNNRSSNVRSGPSRPTTDNQQDAFSSLFPLDSLSAFSGPGQTANLTLAQRQQQANQHSSRKAQLEKQQNDAMWADFDSKWTLSHNVAATSTAAASNLTTAATTAATSNLTTATTAASANVTTPPPPQPLDPWDFDRLSSQPLPPSSGSQTIPSSNDPFDFGCFEQSSSTTLTAITNNHRQPDQQASSGLINDDEILGALARPVESVSSSHLKSAFAATQQQSPSASSSSYGSRVPSPASGSRPRPTRASASVRSVSPPPHIVGHIVEMGFSPQQARSALAQTQTGLDVEAALEVLIATETDSACINDQDERLARELHRQEEINLARQARTPTTDTLTPPSSSAATTAPTINADQLYAQASEIGTSMLSKANAFWTSAKAQAQKALEERNLAATPSGDSSSQPSESKTRPSRWAVGAKPKNEWNGKPKWMMDAELESTDQDDPHLAFTDEQQDGFKDSDNESESAKATKLPLRQQPEQEPKRRRPAETLTSSIERIVPLWDQPEPSQHLQPEQPQRKPYVSPNRRAPARSAAAASTASTSGPLTEPRILTSDDASTIDMAFQWKKQGNQHFSKGAYGEAESCYTRAIDAFISSDLSLRLIPLLNNRANCRLKNGDSQGTIRDCDQVLTIVLSTHHGGAERNQGKVAVYRASQESPLPAEFCEINLRESYAKALLRRAQALEAVEKWQLAKCDWQVLLEYEKCEGSGTKTGMANLKLAKEGLVRSQKALGEVSETNTATTRTRPSLATTTKTTENDSLTQHYRQVTSNQAKEDEEKHQLKDQVDEKIDDWKRGKETNLRALLSSLDSIVWHQLGWKPVGLHQILDANQLKKVYTRAIAKLHPDKLSSKTVTLEQKMIATGAFHVLNQAWNATTSQ